MLTEAGRILRRIVLPLAALTLVMVGVGLLITRALENTWPLSTEDGVDRAFADHRTGLWNAVSAFFSGLGYPLAVTLGTVAVGAVAWWLGRRNWRGPVFLVASLAAQAVVAGLTGLFVARGRPDVVRLGGFSAESSFPSWHLGGVVVLFCGSAVLLTVYLRRLRGNAPGPLLALVWTVAVTVPLLVALSRIYRGTHHPSDIVASFVLGGAVLVIMNRALLSPKAVWGRPRPSANDPVGSRRRAGVVVNPIKLDGPDDRARIARAMTDAGWEQPLWFETTIEDPGAGATAKALAEGVDLVVVCGGDGTVRECAAALAGTDVPLAVLPAGTGNLLARNLGLPIDLADAAHVAVRGQDRRIDLGAVAFDSEDGACDERCFTAMAGIGLDAAMMADAPDALKKKVGWPAYAVSGLRHLRDARMRVTLRIDGGEPVRRWARMVLVGNVGSLQAGMRLLPGAAPDDGLLDVVVFSPKGVTGWAHAAVNVIGRRRHDEAVVPPRQHRWRPIEHFTARTVDIETDRPEPRELDGDPIGEGTKLVVRVRPGVLTVRVPRGSAPTVNGAGPGRNATQQEAGQETGQGGHETEPAQAEA